MIECRQDAGVMRQCGQDDVRMEYLMGSKKVIKFAWEPFLGDSVRIDQGTYDVQGT